MIHRITEESAEHEDFGHKANGLIWLSKGQSSGGGYETPQSYIVSPDESAEGVLVAAKDLLAGDSEHPLWFRSSAFDELPGANSSPIVLVNPGTTLAETEAAIATASLNGKGHWVLQRGAVTRTKHGWGDQETSFYARSHSFNPDDITISARFGLGMPIADGSNDSFHIDADRRSGKIKGVACYRSYTNKQGGMSTIQVLITYLNSKGKLVTEVISLDRNNYKNIDFDALTVYEGKFNLRDRIHELPFDEPEMKQIGCLPFKEDILRRIIDLTKDLSSRRSQPVQIEGVVSDKLINLVQIREDHSFSPGEIVIPEVPQRDIIATLEEVMAPIDITTDLILIAGVSQEDLYDSASRRRPNHALMFNFNPSKYATSKIMAGYLKDNNCPIVITTGREGSQGHLRGSMRVRRARGEATFYGSIGEGKSPQFNYKEPEVIPNVRIVSDGRRGLIYRLPS